jgi:parallel beta-helix repeat protein
MTFTVNTESDLLDAAPSCDIAENWAIDPALLPGPDGLVSLREAVCAANGNPGPDSVHFDIGGPGPYMITLDPFSGTTSATASLFLTDAGTTIDGTTQPGYIDSPLIMITSTVSPVYGFEVLTADNVIRGLALSGMTQGIRIESPAADGNLIEGNYLGTDLSGTLDQGNGAGIQFFNGADNNIVRLNLISGNSTGIGILSVDSTANLIQDNVIGTDVAGTSALPNGIGVKIVGAAGNSILSNTISGNLLDGVLVQGATATGNLIVGNRIGTDAGGVAALGNGHNGVSIDGASAATITGNVVSGNIWSGINLDGSGNVVQDNKIGTDWSGTAAIPNAPDGYPPGSGPYYVSACGALEPFFRALRILGSDNTIGAPGAGNLISGNTLDGVLILGGSNNVVQGNYIGTDVGGASALSNGGYGVHVRPGPGCSGATGNLIGGPGGGQGNVISGNNAAGVYVIGPADSNYLQGNYIGTDLYGTAAIPNGIGVRLGSIGSVGGPTGTVISNNVISGNGNDGMELIASGNVIEANVIGADVSGTAALANAGAGIHLAQSAASGVASTDNLVLENVIAYNGFEGIVLCCAETVGQSMRRNSIFQNSGAGINTGSSNASIDVPELTSADANSVEGTACAGCTVEVFVADPDPTGFGEGKTFLGDGIATGGSFSIPISLVCGEVTATATDAAGNTSEFSENLAAGACLSLFNPLILAGALLVPASALGGLLWRLRKTTLWLVVGAVGGAALGAAVFFVARSAVSKLPTETSSAVVSIPSPPSLASDSQAPISSPTIPAGDLVVATSLTPRVTVTDTATPTPPSTFTSTARPPTATFTPPPPTKTATPVPDTSGPSIKSVSDSPDPIKVSQPKGCTLTTATVSAAISDPSGVQSAYVLFFHTTIGQVPMSHGGGNTWSAVLGPYTGIGDGTVDYQVHATDGQGNATDSAFGQITVLACLK